MSYYDFSRNFTKKCGISYIRMVNRVKVQRAKDLLNSTDLSVTDIASILNYSSVSYFNQVFRKYSGFPRLPTGSWMTDTLPDTTVIVSSQHFTHQAAEKLQPERNV